MPGLAPGLSTQHKTPLVGECGMVTKTVWVRAVPEPFYGGIFDRIRDAWSVIRGETFAIYWPKAGELEDAMSRNRCQSNASLDAASCSRS